MQQAKDFSDESADLAAILEPLADEDFALVTQFKGWSINDVLGHLHMFNIAALRSLEGETAFDKFIKPVLDEIKSGKSILESQYPFIGELKGRTLFDIWKQGASDVASAFATANPKARLKWLLGPDMSAISSITARQMETWAHGQEVFDLLGVQRQETDRIRNIVFLGVNTFGWSFINRKLDVPTPPPYIRLTAPSGEIWEWNEVRDDNCITGSAVEFAQIVTQVRNVDDTSIVATGETAKTWMRYAQCFAGPVEAPPKKGQRFMDDRPR